MPGASDAASIIAAVQVTPALVSSTALACAESRRPVHSRTASPLRSKRLPVKPEGIERDRFTILQPQSAGAIRAREAADGGGMVGILYSECHDLRPSDICALDGTCYASALRTDEIAANVELA